MIDNAQWTAVAGAASWATRRFLPGCSDHDADAAGELRADYRADTLAAAWEMMVERQRAAAAVDAETGGEMCEEPFPDDDEHVRYVCKSVINRTRDAARRRGRQALDRPETLTCEATGEQLDIEDRGRTVAAFEAHQTVELLRRTMPPRQFSLLQRLGDVDKLVDAYDPKYGTKRRFYEAVAAARLRARRIVEGDLRC